MYKGDSSDSWEDIKLTIQTNHGVKQAIATAEGMTDNILLPHVVRKRTSMLKKKVGIRKLMDIKNSAQVGPEGLTRLVSTTVCDADFPT